MPLTVRVDAPVLYKITPPNGAGLPTVALPKSTELLLRRSAGPLATTPVSVRTCGLAKALVATLTVAVRVPVAPVWGANRALMLQLLPILQLARLTLKSAALAPPILTANTRGY